MARASTSARRLTVAGCSGLCLYPPCLQHRFAPLIAHDPHRLPALSPLVCLNSHCLPGGMGCAHSPVASPCLRFSTGPLLRPSLAFFAAAALTRSTNSSSGTGPRTACPFVTMCIPMLARFLGMVGNLRRRGCFRNIVSLRAFFILNCSDMGIY